MNFSILILFYTESWDAILLVLETLNYTCSDYIHICLVRVAERSNFLEHGDLLEERGMHKTSVELQA